MKPMKKYVLIAVLALTLLGTGKALAAVTNVDPGILPDSKWYFLDKFGEWFDSVFTFGAKNKVELAIHQAEERSAEIKALMEKAGPKAQGLDEALSRLAEAKDAAKNTVNKISDATEKANLSKETDQDFDDLEKGVNDNLGQQIKALIESFKPVKESMLEQIKVAQKAGDTKLTADLRDQLVTKENDLRDQIQALQKQFQETQQQMNEDEKVLEDNLSEPDKTEALKHDAEQQKEQLKQDAEVQLELVKEHSKDLQDHLRLDQPKDGQQEQDLKELENEKQDLEQEIKD